MVLGIPILKHIRVTLLSHSLDAIHGLSTILKRKGDYHRRLVFVSLVVAGLLQYRLLLVCVLVHCLAFLSFYKGKQLQ